MASQWTALTPIQKVRAAEYHTLASRTPEKQEDQEAINDQLDELAGLLAGDNVAVPPPTPPPPPDF